MSDGFGEQNLLGHRLWQKPKASFGITFSSWPRSKYIGLSYDSKSWKALYNIRDRSGISSL